RTRWASLHRNCANSRSAPPGWTAGRSTKRPREGGQASAARAAVPPVGPQRAGQEHHGQCRPKPRRQQFPPGIVQSDQPGVGGHRTGGQDEVEQGGAQEAVGVGSGGKHAARPRNELAMAAVITTSTKLPIHSGGPWKLTCFMFSVFPVSSERSLRE